MKGYTLLKTVSQLLLPFVFLYGFYVTLTGDFSPGGGFQGGLIFSSAYLMIYFIKDEKPAPFKTLLPFEKWTFFFLLAFALILFVTSPAQGVLVHPMAIALRPYLIWLMNLTIGACTTFSFWIIMTIFTEEGDLR